MTPPGGSRDAERYTGRGYWAAQLIMSGLLAILGIGGGIVIVATDGSAATPTEPGTIMLVFLTGVVFLALFVWLLAQLIGSSREERAVQAWAIMQQHSASPRSGVATPAAVRRDLASLDTAQRARNGRLSPAEIRRLQELRPDVPYPGTLPAEPRPVSAHERAARDADDAEASALVGASLDGPRLVARALTIGTRVAGAGALALVALSGTLGVDLFLWCLLLWVALRLGRGIAEDAVLARGRRIATAWTADPARAARGLPTPLHAFVGTPRGAWWSRLAWPAEVLGAILLLGGVANLADAGDERASFVRMAWTGAALLLLGILLWIARERAGAAARRRLRTARGPRADDDLLGP